MSRKKSSRKQGSAPRAKPKLSKHELESVEKRVRKKAGKKPGNKQSEGNLQKEKLQVGIVVKDPRIGSKKPILLGSEKIKVAKVKKPIATNHLKKLILGADATLPLDISDKENEIDEIESDIKLLFISAKQDDGTTLTSDEVDYYNFKMDRYQKLKDELGIDEKDTPSEDVKGTPNSEDDLWDRLDNPDFTEY